MYHQIQPPLYIGENIHEYALRIVREKIPMYIIAIFNNGGITVDQYTVLLNKVDDSRNYKKAKMTALHLSQNCNAPNGVCYWSEFEYTRTNTNLVGKKTRFIDLPKNVQRTIQYKRTQTIMLPFPDSGERQ